MQAKLSIILPVIFLLSLRFHLDLAEEAVASSGSSQVTSGLQNEAAPSRSKRRSYNMLRLTRGLNMLRLGKRADDSATDDETTDGSEESPERLEQLENLLRYYAPVYAADSYPADLYGDGLDENRDADDSEEGEEFYYPGDENNEDDDDDSHFRFRRSGSGLEGGAEGDDGVESWKRSRLSMLRLGKRQDELSNGDFTEEDKRKMSMLRLGKRPMSMLRLGKRPMNMLRLGKRGPMNMLRLGKRGPMNMLRLGKRPMSMLRLGKRGPMNMLRLGKRGPMNMLRLGKKSMSMLRLGKRPMNMLRLGRGPMSMLRLGKRPMNMLRLGRGRMGMLRLGKRSVEDEPGASSENTAEE